MAVNLELGVDLGSFNQGINQAKAQISAFNATLKFAESSFKATGDAEAAMTSKTQALNGKLQAQKSMVQQYSRALEEMRKSGVDQTSEAYLKMQRNMILAQASMNDTQAALNGLNSSQQEAAQSADKLTQSVQGIGKKISLDQVIGGIDRITDGMERAAQKVAEFGKQLWDTIMESARRADDTATMAEMYGIDLQTFKQMQALVANGMDTSVEAILSAQKRLTKGVGSENKAALQALKDLHVSTKTLADTGNGILEFVDKDPAQVFWDIGRALKSTSDAYDKEAAAQALLGRSWEELVPLFNKYETLDDYRKALDNVNVSSEQATVNSAELADKVATLENTWKTLKDEIIGAVAPGLTAGADALNSVLSTVLEYLQKPEGQEMLQKLGESVAGLFDDLANVNPEDVVSNFVTVFDQLTKGLEFLANNWDKVVNGIKEIGVAFGLLKIGEGVLEGLRLINGFRSLLGSGGGATTGAAAGLGAKLLATGVGTAITGTAATVGATITPYLGPMAAIPMVLQDQTALFRTLRNGGSWEEAGNAAIKEVEASAKNAAKAWEDWGTNIVEAPKNLAKVVWDWATGGGKSGDWSGENGDDWSVKVKPEAEEGSAESLSEQIGAVTVPVTLKIAGVGGLSIGGGGGNGLDPLRQAIFGRFNGFANGIPWVNETQLALLHRGERVLTASENKSYTFNSNTYFGSVNLNNGMQIDALSESIAKQNRRQSAAYGA